MDRRDFLKLSVIAPGVLARQQPSEPWRTFAVTTRIQLNGAAGSARVWIPVPASASRAYQKNVRITWSGSTKGRHEQSPEGVEMVVAEWTAAETPRIFEVVATVSTRNHHVRLDDPTAPPKPFRGAAYLKGTSLIVVDRIVRDTALAITAGHTTDLAKARAIYDWIVDNTLRDPTVRGCGLCDIRWMLETRTYAGKCADLNALYVGLARAAGLPARDVYGIRVASSADFASLGRSGGDVTRAQHCRAEVHLSAFGWVPVDPADVAKVRLEERANGSLDDPYLRHARERMFGAWEMNWVAYNEGHDVTLPGSQGKPLPFFMYPQAEIDGIRVDSLDAEQFHYRITARER
jgi:transglutaminase-like putative cysteine protease